MKKSISESNQPNYLQAALDYCDGASTRMRPHIIWSYAELAGFWLLIPETADWYRGEKKLARKLGTMYLGALILAGGGKKQREAWRKREPDLASLLDLARDWYAFKAWAAEQEPIVEHVQEMESLPFGLVVRHEYSLLKARQKAWEKVRKEIRVPKSTTDLYVHEELKFQSPVGHLLD